MKNFEQNISNDTVLTSGLIAIAIAWVAFAAVKGPATDSAARIDAGIHASAGADTVRANVSARTASLPVQPQRTTVGKVS